MPDETAQGSVPPEIKQAWDSLLRARMPVGRALGKPLSGQELRLEGMVHASGWHSRRSGPVVTTLKCRDGAKWVIDYDEQSPYHAFADRWVLVTGMPCEPPMQHVIGVTGHFDVLMMQPIGATPDPWLMEVGAAHYLSGRLEHVAGGAGELTFITDSGDTFFVANNPAGAAVNSTVKVLAYPVRLSPDIARSPQQYLWVICPWSYADLDELRGGPNAGLPCEVYVETTSGQVRRRQDSPGKSVIA